MKKQAGFSLIELVVAMAVLALIMGAMVHLFGGSVTSLHTGARQEVVYEEARLLMNELKTTLRYADKDSIDPKKPDDKTTKFSYSGTMWDRHMDIKDGQNISYDIIVQWKDAGNGLKQLEVKREDRDASGNNISSKTISFPKDTANSLFEAGSPFPITAETVYKEVVMYKIALPVQYLLNGKMKTQTLETKVVPSKDEVTETPEEKMLKEYTTLVSIWHKLRNGKGLTSSERNSLDDFKKFFNENSDLLWQLGSNDEIRKYLLREKYGGIWPKVDINGKTVYMNPYGYDNRKDPITIDNIFLIGYTELDKTGWYVNYVYNQEDKHWYYSKNATALNKPLNEIKEMLKNSKWQIVTKS